MFKISKGYDHVQKTLRLPVEMVEQLENIAAENNLSLNKLIIQCIEYALKHLD